jgi:ketosteroid isomerase-like protein
MLAGAAAASEAKPGGLDKAYIQAYWDGWASGNLEAQGKFFVQGPGHLFFDITPLKYTSWDEYKAGVSPVLSSFSNMKFTLNDDLQIHPAGKMAWVVGTINLSAKDAKGQPTSMVLRWTAVFEKQGGRWIMQHEHVSIPMAGS